MGTGESDSLSSTTGAQFGKYKILRRLGEGAFGVVYEALQPGPMGFEKRVAIKMLRSYLVRDDPRFVQSMVNEARIGGLLHHANIVDILEFGQERDRWYLAMEYVEGPTLAEILALCRERKALLPRFAVVDLGLQICRGLHHAHEFQDSSGQPLSLIHRDLKPSNIIVDRSGIAKVCDFGIAKAASNLYDTTTSGMVKGTPRYMSPEQIAGERDLDRRSDLFSFGVILFELITGRILYDAGSLPALIHQIAYDDTSPRLVAAEAAFPGSQAVLERLLTRDREARYPDAMALSDDLRELGRAYPAAAEMSEVIRRVMPALDRTGSTEIGSTGDLGLGHSEPEVDEEATELQPISDFTPIPAPAPTSGGWERFSEVFDASSGSAEPAARMATPPKRVPTPRDTPVSPDTSADWASRGAPALSRWLVYLLAGFALLLIGLLGGLLVTSIMDGGFTRWTTGAASGASQDESGQAGMENAGDVKEDAGAVAISSPAESESPGEVGDGAPTPSPDRGSGEDASEIIGAEVEPEPDVDREKRPERVESRPETPDDEEPTPVEETPEAPPPPAAEPGTVSVTSIPWAKMYLDDQFVGQPNSLRKHAVAGGAHTLLLVCGDVCGEGEHKKEFNFEVDGADVNLGCWNFHSRTPTCGERR